MSSKVRSRRGFVLAATAACLPVLIAGLGLVVDAGRILAAKAELQAFTDTAALAAAAELDGTSEGLYRARAVAISGPSAESVTNRWEFSTQEVSGAQAAFSRAATGPFEASPSPAGVRFVRVSVAGEVPLYFLPVLPGVGRRQTVLATAVAGQAVQTSIGNGLSPFSPDAHDPADPNFGFTKGELYTLKWPPEGHRNKNNLCQGDKDFVPAGGSSDRGYMDVGQADGNSGLHDVIVDNEFFLSTPVTVGLPIAMVTGNKHVGPAVEERFNQDTDLASTTYSTYTGNGRRLIIIAVNDHTDAANVVGFALFFLPPLACGHGNVSPCCAEYVGPAVFAGRRAGAGNAGLYVVRLFE